MVEHQPPVAAESNRQSSQAAFNLGALSTKQILRLDQALWGVYLDALYSPVAETGEFGDSRLEDEMLGLFKSGFLDLVAQDLDRAREVLQSLATSSDPYNRETAAGCAPAFAQHDLAFASEIVLGLQGDREVLDSPGEALMGMEPYMSPDEFTAFERLAEQRIDQRHRRESPS